MCLGAIRCLKLCCICQRWGFSMCVCVCACWGQPMCSSTCYNTSDKQGKQPCTVCSPSVVTWPKATDERLSLHMSITEGYFDHLLSSRHSSCTIKVQEPKPLLLITFCMPLSSWGQSSWAAVAQLTSQIDSGCSEVALEGIQYISASVPILALSIIQKACVCVHA